MKCAFCGQLQCAGHTFRPEMARDFVAGTVADLRTKAKNFRALVGGLELDLTKLPRDRRHYYSVFRIQAHLAQIEDVLDLLKEVYPDGRVK